MSRKKSTEQKIFSQLGLRLLEIEESRGLERKDFANRIGYTPAYLTQLILGQRINPSKRLISAISSELGINKDWLLTGEGEKEKPIYEIPDKDNLGVVKESKAEYYDIVTQKILQMLDGMSEEDRREILRYIEKEKLLKDLLEEKRAKKGGK